MPPPSADQVRRVLALGALRPRDAGGALPPVDPAAAAALLERHKVRGLAAERLAARRDVHARAVADALAPAAGKAAARSAAARRLAADVAAESAHQGWTVRGMKGIAAQRWYADPGRRDVSDLDLWVPDLETALRLGGWLRRRRGHRPAAFELPWVKTAQPAAGRDGEPLGTAAKTVYGVMMLEPPDDSSVHVDVHVGDYSVRHCAHLAVGTPAGSAAGEQPVTPEGLTLLSREDTLCCIVANAAGDVFADLKTANDLLLALGDDRVDWDAVRDRLARVRLLGFLAVLLDRLAELEELDADTAERVRALRPPGGEPAPDLVAADWGLRRRVTVRHAWEVGREQSWPHAARLAATAYRYYRRPHRLRLGRGVSGLSRPFRLETNPWTCVRLVPVTELAALAGRDAPSPPPFPDPARGLRTIATDDGDVVDLGGEIFLPTVHYRVSPAHLRRALVLAGRTPIVT
jgi:hypothetical protein